MEHEVFAAWHRAVERYGADLIEPGRLDRIEDRQTKAFVRLVSEVSSESPVTESTVTESKLTEQESDI